MALWSVVLALALLTTRAWSTQDDLGTKDTDGDPQRGLSFILPAAYKDPKPHPGTRAKNPFLRRKSLEVEAPPLSTVTREPDIVIRYIDGHEEVFEKDLREHGLDGERVRRQVESSKEADGEAGSGAGPPRVFDLGETADGGGKAVSGGAEGKSGSYRSDDGVKERGKTTEGEEQETSRIDVTSEPISQASVDHGEEEDASNVTHASNENRSAQNDQLTHTTDGAEELRTEAETPTVKRERQRELPPPGREFPDVQEMSSSLGFSIRQYYQDLLSYYALYQAPSNHLPLDQERAVYEAPGAESGINAHTTYQQNLPHYYVVYPYGSNWSPAGGSSLMQNFRYESPSVSEAAGNDVYRLTMDRLQEALRAPSDQPDDEESPNRSAKPPANSSNPPASPDEPPVKPENLPTNPSEAPTNLKESRTPSRIPNQLRTLFSRVGRGSSRACQAGKCEADGDAKTTLLGNERESDPLAGTLGGVLRYTQPFMYTFPLSRRGLSWPFGYDLAPGPVYYPSTHLISPHWQNSPSAYDSNPSSPSDNPFSYSSSPSMHTNNPASHTDNLFSHPNNPPSHANHPSSDTNPPSHANSHFSGTNNPFSYTNPPSDANSFSSDTNRPSSHANNHFQRLSNPLFDPSSRSTPQEFDDDSRESPVDSHSEEKFEPRDRESTSGRRPHGSYTPSNEHKGTIQDSRNGNGAGDTTRLTYDSLSPSNHDHQAYRFHAESDVTGLPPHGKAAADNHFPYDLQLGYNMYTINTGGGPPTDARVLVSHSELQSSVKPNTRDVENNHEYRANERAQIPADPIGYKTQVLTGDQGRYETQGDNNQKVSGVQGKYQLGEITGPNQPMYGYRWVSDDRTEANGGEAYYVSIAEQGAREQAEPDPVIAQRNRRQRNHETLYPFLILHHGQEL